jgi:hypothetical protein
LVVGLLGELVWVVRNANRPGMPVGLQDATAGAACILLCSPFFLALYIWAPDKLRYLLGLGLVMIALGTSAKPSWRDQSAPQHPMTSFWRHAWRHHHHYAGLCVASAAIVAVTAFQDHMILSGLGAIAAMNLTYFHAMIRRRAEGDEELPWQAAAPFCLAIAAFVGTVMSHQAQLVVAGEHFTLGSSTFVAVAAIPDDDAATLVLLVNYLGIVLASVLLRTIVDFVFAHLRVDEGWRAIIMRTVTYLRAVTCLILFFMQAPQITTTASASALWLLLTVLEGLILLMPSPEPGVSKAGPAPMAAPAEA